MNLLTQYTLALQENEFKNMTRDQLLSVRAGILKKAVWCGRLYRYSESETVQDPTRSTVVEWPSGMGWSRSFPDG